MVSTPPAEARAGGRYAYAVDVVDPAGDLDPCTFELVAAPEAMDVSPKGEVTWSPTPADVGEHMVSLRVSDGDGGEFLHDWTVAVAQNAAPPRPEPLFPEPSACVAVADPTLLARAGIDPDGDALVHRFELDSDPSFGRPRHGPPEGVPTGDGGIAAWKVEEPLAAGRWYWRVRSSDGIDESEPAVGEFEVCAGVGPDPDPEDGGGDVESEEPATLHDAPSCACRAPSSGGGGAWTAALAVLGLARRRQREVRTS